MPRLDVELPVTIERQPNYTTCGRTALHALYRYFGDDITLPQVISEVRQHPTGGTVSMHLCRARAAARLRRGDVGVECELLGSDVVRLESESRPEVARALRSERLAFERAACTRACRFR